ncbi:unnamed protein product [Meloidogyne enterolobii]|uniref:Uncharacterized protein n=1 Tax=Meloidogyne enterolobii TaxID=390850 RepID=A0ACB1A6B2_MELEN
MAPTSAGLFSVLRLNKFPNNFYLKIFIFLLALFTTLNCSVNVAKFNARLSVFSSDFETLQQRHKRATTESLLTVEWEGIQSGDHPDSSIRGFIVEYKAEGENQWNVHSGIIPYKGPNHQYRVQACGNFYEELYLKIPKLPTGISYFVRIKVLGSKGEVLVETPEIRAKNEIVSIHCEPEEITSPNNIKIKEQSKFSIAITWQPPECGSIGEYQLELKGLNLQSFDVHRQTVSQPQASISGLISGTEYSLRIRAIDRARIVGPWSEELITVSTKGELPEQLSNAQLEYISDKEVRISWTPLDHPRLQHYEIVLTEIINNSKQKNTKQHKEDEEDGEKVERTRVAPTQTNVYFGDLKPDTEYKIGVLAYIDHEPVRLQRLTLQTNIEHPIESSQKPMVLQLESGEYEVHWKPQPELQYSQYILEYKLGNETTKWYLLTKKEETNQQQQQQSYSIKTTKLEDAISVRLLFIGEKEEGKKPILIAKTEESLVGHKSIGNSCERVASGEPKFLEEEGEGEVKNKIVLIPETIKFKWEQVKCEGHIEGWEYMIWPAEDGHQPLEGSVPEFTSQPQVLLQGLEASTEYRFKVRHRLPHGGHGPWSPTASGRTKISKKEGEEEKEEGGETSENIYRLRIALVPPRSFLVWTPLPEHAKRIHRFKVSHKPTAPTLADGVTVEGPTEQFVACPPGISQPGVDFCLDLRGLELGRQYSAEILYQLDGPTGKWSKKGAPLFFILVDEDVNKEEKGQQQQLNIGQIRIEQLEGKPKSVVHWTADGPMLDQIRAYQVEIRGGPQQIWRPISGYVAAVQAGQKQFRVEIDSALLAGQAEIRLKALGSDGKPVVESLPLGTGKPCEPITQSPKDVILTTERSSYLIIRWTFPQPKDLKEIERCHFHFLVGGILNGAALQRTVDGNLRELKLEIEEKIKGRLLSPQNIRLSVHAVNRLGAGPASIPVSVVGGIENMATLPEKTNNQNQHKRFRRKICDPRTDFWCREESFNVNDGLPHEKALISPPTVSTSPEGSLQVQWRSKGPGRGVFGYRVLYRYPGGGWNPYGQIVPYTGDDEDYNLALTGLSPGVPYELKIQTLDRNSYVLFTSQDVRSSSTCLPPTQPPSQLAIDAPDARHVRVTWVPVVQSVWKCSEAKVELQIDEPRGKPPVFLDARQSSHVFDALPAQRMARDFLKIFLIKEYFLKTIRARTTNEAGHSPWSSSVSVSTLSSAQSLAEPIDGPFVSLVHGMPRLSWKGREGSDPELVDHFIIEWRTRTEQRWNQLPQRIQFTGWQRPYNVDLDQLPAGHLYEVRLRALDHNLGTAFLSGTVTVQAQAQCRPPHSSPRNLEITPLGPNQLRLSWHPLPETEWNCDQLWYVVKYSSTEQQVGLIDKRPENLEVLVASPVYPHLNVKIA